MTESNQEMSGLGARLLRSAAQYTAGASLNLAASMARVALTAHVLNPKEAGIWLGLQLLVSYGSNLHVGALFGLYRSVPLLRAAGRDDAAEAEKRTSFTFLIGMLGLGIPILVGVGWASARPRYAIGIGILVAVTLLRSYFLTVFRAESRFKELSISSLLGAGGGILGLGLVYRWKLDGVIIATIFQTFVEGAYLLARSKLPGWELHWPVLREQLKVGVVTLLTTIGIIALTTIDRTVMLQYCGSDATGSYYIGANLLILFPTVAGIPASVLTPKFFEHVGRGEDVTMLVQKPVQIASLVLPFVIAVGALAIPATVAILWPHLSSGNSAARAALFATFPLVMAGLVTNVYYAHNRQGVHVAILALACACSYAFALSAVRLLSLNILGAAAGAALGIYLYYVALCVGAFWVLRAPRSGARLALTSLGPMLFGIIIVITIDVVLSRWWAPQSPTRAAVGIMCASIMMTPMLLRARKLIRVYL